ncbi:MAG: ABC transporter substrate-binding protein [Novosphingobium sp.]
MHLTKQSGRLFLLLGMLLTGCTGNSDNIVDVAVIGQPASLFENGGRIPQSARLLRNATAEGLVSLDEQGRAVPAVADRWIVTDDGMSYIFRLRNGNWPDGAPMTAESGRQALREAIAALRGTPMALDLKAIDDIRVMAGRVIEVRLSSPQPDFLMILAQPELGLRRRNRGAGPMILTREKDIATLTPIAPERLGLPAMEGWSKRVRALRLQAQPAKKAIALYAEGKVMVVQGGTFADLPLVDAAGISRGGLQIDPAAGLFGLAMAHGSGFLSQPANREAIAMAIDRSRLANTIGVGGWETTTRVVPPTADGDFAELGERWTSLSLEERRAVARARVLRWKAGKSEPQRLRIALPAGPGAVKLFAQLKEDLAAVGIAAERVAEDAATDLRLVDDVAPVERASWYFHRFDCSAQRNMCDSAADRTFAEALEAETPGEHTRLLSEAEAKLTAANIFIPLGQPVRWTLVGGAATGFVPNRLAFHPLMPMALRPK